MSLSEKQRHKEGETMKECSKTKDGKCGHNLECVYCPEIKKENSYYSARNPKVHYEHNDDDADDFCD